MIAVANQGRAIAGHSSLDGATGTLPVLYGLPGTDFHDITSGSNGYSAGVGYDLVTGIGSPVANLLLPGLVETTPGLASRLAFTQQPTTTSAGAVIDPTTGIQVAVEDAYGTIVTSDSSSVTVTLSGGVFASGASTVTVAAVNGVATFSNLAINAPGHYTLTASDGSLSPATSQTLAILARRRSWRSFSSRRIPRRAWP